MKKIHHICPECNSIFVGRKAKIFCSLGCYNKSKKGSKPWNAGLVGIKANRPKNGIDKTCPICKNLFYVPKSTMSQIYCSMNCYRKARWGGSRLTIKKCVICHTNFERALSNDKTTCSKKCSSEKKSLEHRGDKSHLWRGGKTAPYNGEWRNKRAEAMRRDNHKCTICGKEDGLSVHHLVPYRYSKSHALENLTTLCRSCHSREEIKINKEFRDGLKKRWG